MKKYLLLVMLSCAVIHTHAQTCPVCTIDLTCDSIPANPKLCPENLPTDTAGNYYSADLTFYVPKYFIHPAYDTVTINQIDIIGVTNLPPGMNWEAYNYLGVATNSFFPTANPPASERGCAKICGTPPLPFDDSIYVSTIAYVTALGTNATQNATFGIYLKIVPGASGNNSFTMSTGVGCGSVTTSFTTLYSSNGNPNYSYLWNFGNGLQSVSENPPSQTYNAPGTYPVSLQTTIDTFPYTLTQITITNIGCSDIGTDPDLYLKIFDGNGALVLSTQNSPLSGALPLTWNLATTLNNPIYTVQIWDLDGGTEGPDDNCVNGSETSQSGIALLIPASGQYGNISQAGINQNLALNYIINKPVIIFNDTSLVNVYANPEPPIILFTPNDSVCSGDSTLLWVEGSFGSYQWYRDSILLVGETDSSYLASVTGNYWVKVTNSYGCSSNSEVQNFIVIPMPPKPDYIFIGSNQLIVFSFGAYNLQWYFNGDPIPGATNDTLIYDASGNYSVCASTLFCVSCSNTKPQNYVPPAGTDEISFVENIKIYPNPNKGEFVVFFETLKEENISVSISDILGREIYIEKFHATGTVSKNILLENTDAGIYFMKISCSDNNFYTKISVE